MVDEAKLGEANVIRLDKSEYIQRSSRSLIGRGLETLTELRRIVRFPREITIGDVYLFGPGTDVSAWFIYLSELRWDGPFSDYLVESIEGAQGELEIGKGEELVLVVNADNKSSLRHLQELSPDAVDGLLLTGSVSDHESRYFEHFTNLKYFSAQSENITNAFFDRFPSTERLKYLDVRYSGLTDSGSARLCEFKSIEYLDLARTEITDNGLSRIGKVKNLKYLNLDMTGVSCNGFKDFPEESGLATLHMYNCRSVESGIENITRLRKLRSLNLHSTGITDAGLFHVGKLSSLISLNLQDARITADGISNLARLSNLEELNLNYTNLPNEAMLDVSNLSNLRTLEIKIEGISQEGLRYLFTLRNLRKMSLYRMGFSDSEIDEARKSMPLCEITWEGEPIMAQFICGYGRHEDFINF